MPLTYHTQYTNMNICKIYYTLKTCYYQSVKTQRILNQSMQKYDKHIKIRHIFLSKALADEMYIL